MQKNVLSLLLGSLFLTQTGQALVRFGLQGGINSSNVSVTPAASTNSRTSFMGGVLLELGAGSAFYLQPELLYVSKGYKQALGTNLETTAKSDYLDIPVLLKYKLDLPLIKPFLFAGPRLGFKLSAASQTTGFQDTDTSSLYTDTDFGLDFGGGAELAFTPVTSLFGSVRYALGLSDTSITTISEVKNNGVQILFGLIMGI